MYQSIFHEIFENFERIDCHSIVEWHLLWSALKMGIHTYEYTTYQQTYVYYNLNETPSFRTLAQYGILLFWQLHREILVFFYFLFASNRCQSENIEIVPFSFSRSWFKLRKTNRNAKFFIVLIDCFFTVFIVIGHRWVRNTTNWNKAKKFECLNWMVTTK